MDSCAEDFQLVSECFQKNYSPSLAWPTLPTAKTGRFDISVKERRDDGDATLKFPHSAVRVGKTVCRVYSVFAEDKGFQGETRTPGKDARRD